MTSDSLTRIWLATVWLNTSMKSLDSWPFRLSLVEIYACMVSFRFSHVEYGRFMQYWNAIPKNKCAVIKYPFKVKQDGGCRDLIGWEGWVQGSGSLAPLAECLGNSTSHLQGCLAHGCDYYYLEPVTLATGWLFPTFGLDLLCFIPSESQNNNKIPLTPPSFYCI